MDNTEKQQTSATTASASANSNANALMQKALRELRQLKAKLGEIERRAHEPIAVIGIGCRYPGGINTPDQFWQVLEQGKDCITQLTDERWNMDDLYDPDPEAPGKIYTRALGIVDNVDYFDAEFFGISPREVETMDPQHRLMLETAYEAMESSGYAPSSLSGQAIGVFVGMASNDFAHLGSRFGDPANLTPWSGTGNAMCAAAGRISYLFNFTGPSLAVDTACSSSLVALHTAVRSLRSGECDGALVGGVNLVLNPGGLIIFSKARMLSEKGACSTFDAGADGYVRAEGCAMLMLKRLSDAERDNDTILGVIRGSAINQDGKSQGLTAPNELAQEKVIRAALADAQLTGLDVHYVEAHGTGTPLGDPIELAALNTVYGAGRDSTKPLLVGSVKTNFG
ncbi:MAG TPA: polyketide synthase, partial [Pseudomonadales bacterium]|nr:polyketide synthase [Pseudomonadales bacterium]